MVSWKYYKLQKFIYTYREKYWYSSGDIFFDRIQGTIYHSTDKSLESARLIVLRNSPKSTYYRYMVITPGYNCRWMVDLDGL